MANSTQSGNLDTTIAALQQAPSAIPLTDAIAIIESWQQQLQGQDIAEDLGELKQALQQNDTAQITSILSDLGEDTAEVAADLPAEVAEKVRQLSMLLAEAAESSEAAEA